MKQEHPVVSDVFFSDEQAVRKAKASICKTVAVGVGVLLLTSTVSVGGMFAALHTVQKAYDSSDTSLKTVWKETSAKTAPASNADANNTAADTWTSPQLIWAQENRITWNELGYPVDASGHVVDDPTTDIDERVRASLGSSDENVSSDTGFGSADADIMTPSHSADTTPAADQNPENHISSGSRGSYTIQQGDTLWDISQRTGYTVADLANVNQISDPNVIFTGTRLVFPTGLYSTGSSEIPGLG